MWVSQINYLSAQDSNRFMSTLDMNSSSMAKRPRTSGVLMTIIGSIAILSAGVVGGMKFEDGRANNLSDHNQPHLVLRNGGKGEAFPAGLIATPIANSDDYKTSYYVISDPFTINIRGSDAIIETSLTLSTLCDQVVMDNVKQNEPAVKSTIINTISAESAAELRSETGRERMRRRIIESVNRLLVEKTGYGGIEDAYITDMITQ
jgi:flagellar FliL protein